jgi:hypothetical protein
MPLIGIHSHAHVRGETCWMLDAFGNYSMTASMAAMLLRALRD